MKRRIPIAVLLFVFVVMVGLGCLSTGGPSNSNTAPEPTTNDNGAQENGLNDNNDGIVDRDDDDDVTSAEVLVVPRSVGGGLNEAEAFAVERDTTQLIDRIRRRAAARIALEFLGRARQRFRRSLNLARRIERSELAELDDEIQTADFTLETPDGETVCARISNAAFAPAEGAEVDGGAPLAADLSETGERISLRVWINRECTGSDEDYQRFYASFIEVRAEDVELEDEDDSSEGAWRAGDGWAFVQPGALLDLDVEYRARARWDHTDPANRETVYFESGAIGDDIEIAAGRYHVVREETTDEDGNDLVCKKLHANIKFAAHPTVASADLRIGVCVLLEEEGVEVARIRLSGTFQLNDGSDPITLQAGCFAADDLDDSDDCGERIDPDLLDLDDERFSDEPPSSQDSNVPEESFSDTPPSADDTTIIDLDDLPEDG